MHSRAVRIKKLGLVTIRPLSHGDTQTVAALFDRPGTGSRSWGFRSQEPALSHAELAQLATVDSRRHTLVAYVDGDPQPAAIAQLARSDDRGAHAEIAVAVADCYDGRRIGSTLVGVLAADARAAGITHLTDTMNAGRGRTSRSKHLRRKGRVEEGQQSLVAGGCDLRSQRLRP